MSNERKPHRWTSETARAASLKSSGGFTSETGRLASLGAKAIGAVGHQWNSETARAAALKRHGKG